MAATPSVPLHEAARERYLSYALSVITARALPDVRDGLKPVQRRILYTMFHEMSLHPGGRYRKCAAVVGDVMGKYHPHGDLSLYEALARLAQPFSLLKPLVDGQGNFGSLDGDPPAAMRYTECRLTPIAEELLSELGKRTVDYRPSYDGQNEEPIVLPAQFPQLLVNGVEGIAVGLSTRIPSHNLGEIIDACVGILDGHAHTTADLFQYVQGPDFPTGGRVLNDRAHLIQIYSEGHGSIRLRGECVVESEGRKQRVVIVSVPYGTNKSKLVERIGSDVGENKLPLVVDVRDESTDDVRIVLDLKVGASTDAVIAWLYKRTGLETTFPVNMNVLVPREGSGICVPERLDLKSCLDHWLKFRHETVRRRFAFDLAQLEARIHILEGFAIIFADIDEVIRIIRASEGKKDAARKLIERFGLSELQTEAILELKLYKIARLEIKLVLDELEEKRGEAAEIRKILGSPTLLGKRVRSELLELKGLYAHPRRTTIGAAEKAVVYDEDAYVVREDAVLVVTRDGWVKRQSSFTTVDKLRMRDGDELGWLIRTDTATTLTLFGNDGAAYTMKVIDVPATTGHGKPLSSWFALPDGARIIGAIAHDTICFKDLPLDPKPADDDPKPPHMVSVTKQGRIQRFGLAAFAEPSNRNGRRFARLDDGDEVFCAWPSRGGELAAIASQNTHLLVFPVREAPMLLAAGKGTTGIKLDGDDVVVAFELVMNDDSGPSVTLSTNRDIVVSVREAGMGARAGKGRQVLKRGSVTAWKRGPWIRAGEPKAVDTSVDADEGGDE